MGGPENLAAMFNNMSAAGGTQLAVLFNAMSTRGAQRYGQFCARATPTQMAAFTSWIDRATPDETKRAAKYLDGNGSIEPATFISWLESGNGNGAAAGTADAPRKWWQFWRPRGPAKAATSKSSDATTKQNKSGQLRWTPPDAEAPHTATPVVEPTKQVAPQPLASSAAAPQPVASTSPVWEDWLQTLCKNGPFLGAGDQRSEDLAVEEIVRVGKAVLNEQGIAGMQRLIEGTGDRCPGNYTVIDITWNRRIPQWKSKA